MTLDKKLPLVLLTFFLLSVALAFPPVLAETPPVENDTRPAPVEKSARVLILPFTILSEKDLSFLQKGIENMLITRLAREERVEIIGRAETGQAVKTLSGPITGDTARELGKSLSADYVAFGSLTVFDSRISTDAGFIDVREEKQIVTFHQTGESQGDVIAHINAFTQKINEEAFGLAAAIPAAAAATMAQADPVTPETPAAPAEDEPATWKSRNFKMQLESMALGDVDGDGKIETVLVTRRAIHIFRHVDGRFEKIYESKGRSSSKYIGVDIADINNNGRAEIFITNILLERNQLHSFVLEWDGKKYVRIADKMNIHFRVIPGPDREDLLLGQEGGRGGSGQGGIRTVFFRGVYEMIWDGARYQPFEELSLPLGMDIYGFTYGDPMNNSTQMITTFSDTDRIQIFNPAGKREWESTERYVGRNTYIEYMDEFFRDNDEVLRYYIPHRVFVTDFNKAGTNDLIVIQNHDTTRILGKFRTILSGHIECLSGDAVGFNHQWKTRKISGYISDYFVGDVDNDGRKEVACTVVTKGDSMFAGKQSYLLFWNWVPDRGGNDEEM